MKKPLPDEQQSPPSPGQSLGARVEVRDLTWRPFGHPGPVLAGLSLRIDPGQRVLLAGPSGSGKSSLLRAIAGVLTATESGALDGSVLIDGCDLCGPGARVGLMVQDPADAGVAGRVGRDVAFGLENQSVPREAIWPRVRDALGDVRFPYSLDHPVNALSGGEAQRLALAGVLVLQPGLVLLDEPSSMLDPAAATAVREAVWAAVTDAGATVVLVEHHLADWLPTIDRLVVLGPDGAITADGPVATVLRERSRELAAEGVWIPGVPTPVPLPVPAHLCAPLNVAVPPGEPVIRADDVCMIRTLPMGLTGEPGRTVTTLSGVNAVVRAGEIVALVGPSGAGKSTLAALLAGLERPSSGTISAGHQGVGVQRSPSHWSPTELARQVGWVPQQAELAVVARTVREDAMSTCQALGVDNPAPRVDGLLHVLGLSQCAETDPHHLSGGQLRRLALAGAVAHGPTLLVLDEPTVGQDRQTWAAVVGILTAAREAGAAVLVATHDQLLIDIADRSIRLEGGRLVGEMDTTFSDSAPAPAAEVVLPAAGKPRWRPWAQRCGPLSLLGSAVLLLIGALTITTVAQALTGLVAELLLAPLVLGWRGHSRRRLLPGLIAVTSVGFSTWLLSPHQDPLAGVTAGARVAFFVLPGVLLAGFVDPFALGDHLAQRLRLPGRPVVAMVAALQRFETLTVQWQQLRAIRRVRGLDAARGPIARSRQLIALTFAMLVQSLRQAGRMAVAMEARGFSLPTARGVRRTWAQPAPWLAIDTALMLVAALVGTIPLAMGIVG